MNLTPLISIVFILTLENKIMGVHLSVVETFTIVSVISAIGKPLKSFVFILVNASEYNMARQSFNKMFFTVSERHNTVRNDKYLKNGTVKFEDVSAEMEADWAINKVITCIFGEALDRKKERKSIGSKVNNNLSLRRTVAEEDPTIEGEKGKTKEYTVPELKKLLEKSKKTVIKDVNLNIQAGQKIALLGDMDSSLSKFILTLIGETEISRGQIRKKGKIVFLDAAASPFLAGKSIRDNILLEDVFISSRYNRIIKKLGLNLKKFKGQDKCEVLANGINFSQAERRKILLCRMLYVSGDIYIIKDIFGHEEVEVDIKMYKDIVEGILNNKTVMIVMNNEELLQRVDKILSFDMLKVKDMGNYESFMKV